MKRFKLFLFFVLATNFLFAQHSTNLCPIEQWELGVESIGDFGTYTTNATNVRQFIDGPHENDILGWTIQEPSNTGSSVSYVYFSSTPDVTKTYRFSLWVRRKASTSAYIYWFGSPNNNTIAIDGSPNTAAIFLSIQDPIPTADEWYLVVGYIHSNSYSDQINFGGIYNQAGEKVSGIIDYKWSPTATSIGFFTSYYDGLANNESFDFYAPRIEIVNGNEPSVASLIGGAGGGTPIWSEINNGAVYNEGSVGIGVDENDMDPSYKFLVDGDIKTKKVKVTLDGWADHVFDADYNLPSLEEVEMFIKENGHLPEIPSEETVLEEGIFLGEMDAQLLKKIEELTLYILEMKKDIQQLKLENKAMMSHPDRE